MKMKMTIKEAIDILDSERPFGEDRGCGRTDEELEEALTMGINALQICKDCMSRKAVLETSTSVLVTD